MADQVTDSLARMTLIADRRQEEEMMPQAQAADIVRLLSMMNPAVRQDVLNTYLLYHTRHEWLHETLDRKNSLMETLSGDDPSRRALSADIRRLLAMRNLSMARFQEETIEMTEIYRQPDLTFRLWYGYFLEQPRGLHVYQLAMNAADLFFHQHTTSLPAPRESVAERRARRLQNMTSQ